MSFGNEEIVIRFAVLKAAVQLTSRRQLSRNRVYVIVARHSVHRSGEVLSLGLRPTDTIEFMLSVISGCLSLTACVQTHQ